MMVKFTAWHILYFSAVVLDAVCQILLSARFTAKLQTALKLKNFSGSYIREKLSLALS